MLPSRNPQAAYTLTALPAPPTPPPPKVHKMKLSALSKQQRLDGWHYLVCTTADGRQRAARAGANYAPAALAWVAKQWGMIGGKWKRVDA
jgi:hypothetical protein